MKQLFLFMLSAGLVVSSCSKNDGDPTVAESCKIKSIQNVYTYFNGGSDETLYYTYDDKGRVTRIDRGAEQSQDYQTFTYHSDKIVVFDNNYEETTPASQKTTTYNLDASGRIIGDGRYTYKYNSEGYLIEERAVANDLIYTTFFYQNGNLTKMDEYDNAPTPENTTFIDYSNEAAQDLLGFGSYFGYYLTPYYEVLAGYFGKASKNQYVKERRLYNNRTSPETRTKTFTYQKDEKGKITSMKATSPDDTDEYKISYQCK